MSLKGRKQTPEHVANRMAALKANPKWVAHINALARSNSFDRTGVLHSAETRRKMSIAHKGQQTWCCGKPRSIETRQKISAYWQAHPELHNNYIDGKGHERNGARLADMGRLQYRLWREKVFTRDGYKCTKCGASGEIHADHIKPYSTHPELRYSVDNGRTLCVSCHRATDTWGRKALRKKKNP